MFVQWCVKDVHGNDASHDFSDGFDDVRANTPVSRYKRSGRASTS